MKHRINFITNTKIGLALVSLLGVITLAFMWIAINHAVVVGTSVPIWFFLFPLMLVCSFGLYIEVYKTNNECISSRLCWFKWILAENNENIETENGVLFTSEPTKLKDEVKIKYKDKALRFHITGNAAKEIIFINFFAGLMK
jgi:hypothetical protein